MFSSDHFFSIKISNISRDHNCLGAFNIVQILCFNFHFVANISYFILMFITSPFKMDIYKCKKNATDATKSYEIGLFNIVCLCLVANVLVWTRLEQKLFMCTKCFFGIWPWNSLFGVNWETSEHNS